MSEPLLNELRAGRPAAPEALRDRVRAIAATQPAREPFLGRVRAGLRWQRLVVLAPATLVVAVAAAGVIGLTRSDSPAVSGEAAPAAGDAATTLDQLRGAPTEDSFGATKSAAPPAASGSVGPTPGRLQRYQAELQIKVDDVEALSSATKRAQQIAASLGGHVTALSYDAPAEGVGAAQITLRIPTARIESAVTQLSELGTILRQRYGIEDLQPQADSLQAQIETQQRLIARLVKQLANPNLGDEERAVVQSRLAAARRTLTDLQEALRTTRADGRLGTVYLTLTTEPIEAAVPPGDGPIDRVLEILAWEAMAVLFFLVVAGPFLVIGFLVWLALRLRRRHVTTRLLEQN